MAKAARCWPRAPSGKELWHLLGLALCNPCFVLRLLSLQPVFKTDAALSGVLPNPLSPAGYFPSEAIYLFPFQTRGFCLSSFFFLPRGKEPAPPKSLALGMGSDPIRGAQGRPGEERQLWGAGTGGEGVAGLGGLLQWPLTSIDSFAAII